jgi:hypothetical protein
MAFSQKLVKAALDPNTKEVFLFLLTFSGGAITTPIRLVNNIDKIVSRGQEYIAFPLEMTLPADDGESLPSIEIVSQNASLELIDIIRSSGAFIGVKLEFILASTPDVVEFEILNMRVASVEYDKDVIKMTVTVDDLLNTAFPNERYLPSNFQGLFK